MFDFFGWIRRRVCESVIGGFEDAAKVLTPEGEPSTDLDELRKRLEESIAPKQLPAAETEPTKKRRA